MSDNLLIRITKLDLGNLVGLVKLLRYLSNITFFHFQIFVWESIWIKLLKYKHRTQNTIRIWIFYSIYNIFQIQKSIKILLFEWIKLNKLYKTTLSWYWEPI